MAREKGPFQVNGGITTFFPDFTLAVQNRQATIFEEPDEVWAWLEAFHKGSADITQIDHKQPRRRGKKRHIRVAIKDRKVTKPTNKQARQGRRAALQAASPLTETKSWEDGLRSEPESQNGEDSTDTELKISGAAVSPMSLPNHRKTSFKLRGLATPRTCRTAMTGLDAGKDPDGLTQHFPLAPPPHTPELRPDDCNNCLYTSYEGLGRRHLLACSGDRELGNV
ncbi:hypothetical protein NDU88_006211 [Pleurodeles waltl]|uniref:Uncharacterized protein n=1 Tax=Pleurodeles waltl TaxID=8319 RepID=A0AAV7PMT5_PLEWA|nr:hypothetical protein NDU88_006211 [Pleurodeles waltl]